MTLFTDRLLAKKDRTTALLLALFLLLLLLPSANYHVFNGLPLSGIPEFLVLLLVLPLLASRALRRLLHDRLGRLPIVRPRWIAGVITIAIAAKLILFWSGTYDGFLACYRSPAAQPIANECEKSYENPLFRFGATRIDRSMDLGNWNLGFVNSLRFNFYSGFGSISRERLPITVSWRGRIDAAKVQWVRVAYVGQAQIDVGGEQTQLGPQYASIREAVIPFPAGSGNIQIQYTFDDGYRTGQGPIPGPGARFGLWFVPSPEASQDARPFVSADVPWVWRGLGWFVDGIVACILLGILSLYLAILRPELRAAACFGVLGLILVNLPVRSSQLDQLTAIAGICLVFGYTFVNNRRRRILLAYFSILYLSLCRILVLFPNLDAVLIRSAGNDPLTYESFARSILDTGSLEAGEKIFYYQPLSRYIRFTEHLVFGDSDALIAALALGLLNLSIFVMFVWLFRRGKTVRRSTIPAAVAGVFMLIVANSESVNWAIRQGLSDYPTWIILPLVCPLLLGANSPRDKILGTCLLGVSLITRTDQAPVLLFLFLIFLLAHYRADRRSAVAASLTLMAIALLPAAHNLYYGHELVFVPTSAAIPENLVVSPVVLSQVFSNPDARSAVWNQIVTLIPLGFLPSFPWDPDSFVYVGLIGLGACWLASLLEMAWAILSNKTVSASAELFMLAPALFLVAHIPYVATPYYPRLIVSGYLAMGVATVFYWSQLTRK